MANIMSQIKLRNKPSRNGFDLSKKNAFSAKVGELLPIYCKEVLPGDKFNINTKWLTRTSPVNSAAFTRIREYFDFFFVPTDLIWNKFGTFVTNQLSNVQHATNISATYNIQDKHPYFTCNQIVDYLNRIGGQPNELGFTRRGGSVKLLEYLGYGDYDGSWTADALLPRVNAELNPFPLLAYQKIYQDYFRNNQWESAAPYTWNLDYITGATNTSLQIPVASIPTNTSKNMFDLQYCNWNKDYFMGLLPNSQYGDAASVNTGSADGTLNLSLGSVSPFDSTLNLTDANANYTSKGNAEITPQGSGTYAYLTYNNILQRLFLSESQVTSLRNSLGLTSSSISGTASVQTAFTILALRQAQAKQKWAEITQSQRKDYKSQINAHFGVSMSDAYSDYCTYIGGVNGNVDISEVVNTNITGSNDSQIAGKGVGVGQGGINYTAQCHGYIMCIYHAVPLLDYAIDGIKRQNLKTTFMDYAVPEFDATGMVQIPTIELTNRKISAITNEKLLGYAPRYIDYKTDIDEVHGDLAGTRADWTAPISSSYIQDWITDTMSSSFNGLNYAFLKVSPSVLNPIFGINAGSGVDTDQLIVNSYFDIKAVRNLDVNGLPY